MATEIGVIEEVRNRTVLVRVKRQSGCEHCEHRGICEMESQDENRLEVPNDLQARVDDRVEIHIPTRSLVKLSMLVYVLPVLAMILGAYAGSQWAEAHHLRPTALSMMAGGGAFALAFFFLRRLDRAERRKGHYRPRMRRILFSAKGRPDGGNK